MKEQLKVAQCMYNWSPWREEWRVFDKNITMVMNHRLKQVLFFKTRDDPLITPQRWLKDYQGYYSHQRPRVQGTWWRVVSKGGAATPVLTKMYSISHLQPNMLGVALLQRAVTLEENCDSGGLLRELWWQHPAKPLGWHCYFNGSKR